jgi:ubiquinone/menaquinone biosynthesis C-methylase UbiE
MESEPGSPSVRLRQQEEVAAAYAAEYEGDTPLAYFYNRRLERVEELLNGLRSGRVLSVGCGPGKTVRLFSGKPLQYYGVDLSEGMIRYCVDTLRDHPRCHFSVGSVEALAFPDESFDAVLCLGSFEYFENPRAAMNELARVVKEDGIVIVSMHNPLSAYRAWNRYGLRLLLNAAGRLGRRRRKRRQAPAFRWPSLRLYSEKALRTLFATAPIRVDRVTYFDFNVFLAPLDSLFPFAAAYVSRRLEFLSSTPLKRLGTAFIVKGEKLRVLTSGSRGSCAALRNERRPAATGKNGANSSQDTDVFVR